MKKGVTVRSIFSCTVYWVKHMKRDPSESKESLLSSVAPSRAIVKLAIPATLALLAKAVYNIVDTAYIGMLDNDIALTAVGVTVPLLLIMVSIENIFAAGAAVLAGRQLGAKDSEGASRTVTTIIVLSMGLGVLLCVGGIVFMEPLMRAFGASDASLPLAKDYAFWMFIAAPVMTAMEEIFTEDSARAAQFMLWAGRLARAATNIQKA